MPDWVWQVILGIGLTAFLAFCVWLVTSIHDLQVDMERSKTQLSPVWKVVEASLMDAIHHDDPKFARPDALIDKFKNLTITTPEGAELKHYIERRVVDPTVPELERKQAKALLAIMDIVVIEENTAKDKLVNAILTFIVGFSVAALRHLK